MVVKVTCDEVICVTIPCSQDRPYRSWRDKTLIETLICLLEMTIMWKCV